MERRRHGPADRADPDEPQVADIAAVRAVQDAERATILFQMRFARPLPKPIRGTYEFDFEALNSLLDEYGVSATVTLTRRGLSVKPNAKTRLTCGRRYFECGCACR